MLRATYATNPGLAWKDIDIITCRNSLSKLYDFAIGEALDFEIDAEIFGNSMLLTRKEKRNVETLDGYRGYGFTIPRKYNEWDDLARGSSSRHRIVRFGFRSLTYLFRIEADGYPKDMAKPLAEFARESSEHLSDCDDFKKKFRKQLTLNRWPLVSQPKKTGSLSVM